MDIRFRAVGEAVEVVIASTVRALLTPGQEAGARDALFLAGEVRRKRLGGLAVAVERERSTAAED